jgi:hypothetical protein
MNTDNAVIGAMLFNGKRKLYVTQKQEEGQMLNKKKTEGMSKQITKSFCIMRTNVSKGKAGKLSSGTVQKKREKK